jgi:allophanate hydrolase subunit 1
MITVERKKKLDKKIKSFMDRFVKDIYESNLYTVDECIYITQSLMIHMTSMFLTSTKYLMDSTTYRAYSAVMSELLQKHGMDVITIERDAGTIITHN